MKLDIRPCAIAQDANGTLPIPPLRTWVAAFFSRASLRRYWGKPNIDTGGEFTSTETAGLQNVSSEFLRSGYRLTML